MTPVLYALVAAVGNVVGGVAVVRHLRRSLHLIDIGVAFGAGFMISVAFLGIVPVVFAASASAAPWLLAGYLGVHLAQHVLTPHFHFGEETHKVSASAGISALVGLSLHTFFDGVAIASGFHVSDRLGILLFLAVLLHKLPEGVAMASVMLAGGQGPGRALGATAGLGAATLLGVLLTEHAAVLARHGLAISGGVTLYVAASNLVPEFQGKRARAVTVAFISGVAAYVLAERALGALGGHG